MHPPAGEAAAERDSIRRSCTTDCIEAGSLPPARDRSKGRRERKEGELTAVVKGGIRQTPKAQKRKHDDSSAMHETRPALMFHRIAQRICVTMRRSRAVHVAGPGSVRRRRGRAAAVYAGAEQVNSGRPSECGSAYVIHQSRSKTSCGIATCTALYSRSSAVTPCTQRLFAKAMKRES